MMISKNYSEICNEVNVYGLKEKRWEAYKSDEEYEALYVEKKRINFEV